MINTNSILNAFDERRRKLAMSKTAMARRAGVSLPTVNRLLKGSEHRPGVQQLHAIAEALGLEVRLGASTGVTEVCTAAEFRKRRAYDKARQLMRQVQGTMALESQAVRSEIVEDLVEETACKLMAGAPRNLWED